MQSVLRLAVFNVVPTVLELALVTAIIWRLFDWRYAALTFFAVLVYVGFTAGFAARRVRLRRTMNDTDNDASTKALDSLLNYETVKYFGNEAHEAARYDGALARYERAAVRVQVSLNMLNLGQAAIIAVGLTLIMLMAANGVRDGSMTVGKFVLINTYLMQLYQPLNFLGMVYHDDQAGPGGHGADVQPAAGAAGGRGPAGRDGAGGASSKVRPARCGSNRVVRLSARPRNPAWHRFRVPAGRKLAIVGPTGAGKSTISRLLFRFYDVTGGRILIDGQDIRDVTQDSLRAAIGVVPQDTVLFNDTIRYNIAYGRPGRIAGRNRAGGAAGAGARLRPAAAQRLRHARGRARPEAVGRREAARGDRPHHPEGPAHPDPGRGHQRAGHPDRAGDPGGVARGGAASHHAGDRAPAVHRGGCRRDHRAGRMAAWPSAARMRRCWRGRPVCAHVGAAGGGAEQTAGIAAYKGSAERCRQDRRSTAPPI